MKHWKPRNEVSIGHDESWPQSLPPRRLFGIRTGEIQLMLFVGISVGLLAAMIYVAIAYWPDGRSRWGQPYKPPEKLLGSTDPRPPIGGNPKENLFEKSRTSAIPQAPGPAHSIQIPDSATGSAPAADNQAAEAAFPDQL